jgi:hypothetical protein|uniref:Uncharacterized protein n=1 Tax=Myoviridae sp. ct1AP5 TaxID=2825017 RepID=A0A8S5UEA1_9CAUD|nr:MAG TPA: hypothetical protein [Myoviridae sp. ct1AP5]
MKIAIHFTKGNWHTFENETKKVSDDMDIKIKGKYGVIK